MGEKLGLGFNGVYGGYMGELCGVGVGEIGQELRWVAGWVGGGFGYEVPQIPSEVRQPSLRSSMKSCSGCSCTPRPACSAFWPGFD